MDKAGLVPYPCIVSAASLTIPLYPMLYKVLDSLFGMCYHMP